MRKSDSVSAFGVNHTIISKMSLAANARAIEEANRIASVAAKGRKFTAGKSTDDGTWSMTEMLGPSGKQKATVVSRSDDDVNTAVVMRDGEVLPGPLAGPKKKVRTKSGKKVTVRAYNTSPLSEVLRDAPELPKYGKTPAVPRRSAIPIAESNTEGTVIATRKGKGVGFLETAPRPRRTATMGGHEAGEVTAIAVDPKMQRQGIGTQMIAHSARSGHMPAPSATVTNDGAKFSRSFMDRGQGHFQQHHIKSIRQGIKNKSKVELVGLS